MQESHPNVEAASAECGVFGHALVEATLADIPALRDRPVPEGVPPLPPRFLRHGDEQTVVGLRAVLAAIAALPVPRPSFTGYGVVAAPCLAGRIATAQSLAQLRKAGGVAVSPHIVPQCSLHSLAGAVSVALGMHGPNVGVCGGRHAVSEGLLTSLSLLASDADVPGIWLVVSGWTDELPLDAVGMPVVAADGSAVASCRAVAVALAADGQATTGMTCSHRLSLHQANAGRADRPIADGRCAADEILDFATALARPRSGLWSHACHWGEEKWAAEIRLTAHAGAAGGRPYREAA
jgi:hypothetical protein